MVHYSDKLVIPKKMHTCRVCGEIIKSGEQCHLYKGIEDGFYTIYFHNECWDYSRDWEENDWETCSPGEISRKEIKDEMNANARISNENRN